MPRRSSRVIPQSAAGPAPKRRSSAPLDTAATSSKRQRSETPAARRRPARSTAKTSKYFQASASEEHDSASDSAPEDSGSAYDVEPALSGSDSETPDHVSTDHDESNDAKKSSKQRGRSGSTKGKKPKSQGREQDEQDEIITAIKGKELWREGVRTGLGPGKQVFIKKPKARDPGETPYQNYTIHPNTMLFLQDLKENNERQWLKGINHDSRIQYANENILTPTRMKRMMRTTARQRMTGTRSWRASQRGSSKKTRQYQNCPPRTW